MAKISQKMSLNQQLSPQQVLQASLLQLSLPLLEQRIVRELETNPVLEMVEEINESIEDEVEEKDAEKDEEEFEWEELFGVNDEYEYPKSTNKKEDNIEIPIVSKETFSEGIIKQLHDCDASKTEIEISEHILGNLDEQGYLNIESSLISDRMQIDEQDVLKVIRMIQKLDPPGLASKNIQECLLIQSEINNDNHNATAILRDHFDNFVNHRYEKIMSVLDCTKQEFNEAMEYISRLNPSPRVDHNQIDSEVIIPDIIVEDREGSYVVFVQEGSLPEVRINKTYLNMLEKHKDQKEVKKFISSKLESAAWFVEALQQRKKTIQIVMESIIENQADYFYSEKRILKPMILKNIADLVGMDISTISRVTNGKYVQLPWEIKELKTFFSEGIKTKSGDVISNIEVKKYLKKIINSEDKDSPISDEELTEIINKKGYKIARRTVAKYRKELKFPAARLRRKI